MRSESTLEADPDQLFRLRQADRFLEPSSKQRTLWSLLDKRRAQKEYQGQQACRGMNVLVVGAGPCGLRTAIECALLGAHVVVAEGRDKFTRNNVLHLWQFVIHDLKALGAKVFMPKFCTGSIEHICEWAAAARPRPLPFFSHPEAAVHPAQGGPAAGRAVLRLGAVRGPV